MADIKCVYEMNMLKENEQMDKDILSGRGMDVLFCLMDGMRTCMEIAQKICIPVYSVNLYLKRFMNAKMVVENSVGVVNGEIEKRYSLACDNMEIINKLEKTTGPSSRRKNEIAAQHFALMTKSAINCAGNNTDKPNTVRAYFMKANKEKMASFKKEIDELYDKYQSLEDKEESDTYSLFTVMTPYDGQ